MILQRIRIIVGDAGLEPGTSASEVRCTSNEPPHHLFSYCVKVSVVDPDPHGSGTFAWIRIRIQQKVKEHINKTVNSGLFVP